MLLLLLNPSRYAAPVPRIRRDFEASLPLGHRLLVYQRKKSSVYYCRTAPNQTGFTARKVTLYFCLYDTTAASCISKMKPIYLTYLNGPDIVALEMTNDEILQAVEDALDAQGRGKTVIEPRVHLVPRDSAEGHFNVLRGVVNPLTRPASRL